MKPACGRADLVRALASGDPELLRATAEILGFAAPAAEQVHEEPSEHRAQVRDGSEIEQAPTVLAEPRPLVDIPFWRLQSYTAVAEGGEPEMPVAAPPVIWTNRPAEPPRFRLLSPWRELQPRLRRIATENREGQAVDMAAVVRCLSEGRLMDRLPRERRRRWGLQLQLIVDRSERLVPFWADQDAVCHRLARLLPPHAIELTAVWEGLPAPRVLTATWSESTYRPPPPGSLVLVLGDLGGLAPGDLQAHHLWLDLGRNLAEGGCRPVALIPCPLGRCPNDLRRYWVLLPWERPRDRAVTDRTRLRQRAERLLRLVSPAVRIEPGFLRAVRLLLPASEADAGTEADAWQHPAVTSTSVEGATLDPEAAKALRAAFAQEPPELQRQVLALLRVWRGQLPQEIWFEEIECLAPASRALLPELEDLTLARDFFVQLSQQARGVLPGGVAAGALSWYRRAERRVIPSRADPAAAEAMHKLAWALHRNEPGYLPAAGFDPAWAPATRERRLVVRQRGETLVLTEQADSGVVAEGPGSLLATLHSANGLIRIEPLPWAADWGTDEFGHWVTFAVEGESGERIVQRLRWIPPGTFLMGSPPDEPERWDDEGPQHPVTISEGFWLFDTACNQALWEAVMGENLSRFQGADRPVENVSWHDCQDFIQRLNERLPDLELQLPTEAQWEYACRAGTQKPFSFGDNITPEQVNYDGNYPYAGAKKRLYRGETVPVASLPPNPWGLYEMHGNVLEWCQDGLREYQDAAETDPLGPLETGAVRVFRGGSWYAYARHVRAAYRAQGHPDDRRDGLGFRCARVQAGAEPPDLPGGATLVRLDDSVREARCPIPQGSSLLIRSDRERLIFGFQTKPSWAAAMGRDRYGLWAEVDLDTGQGEPITQGLRWVPPGRFRMGSPEFERARFPEDERHWFDREGPQHEVLISQGFWLFDTPCTQVLWTAVMGENPSRFQSSDRPVEQVNWVQVQEFIQRINGRIPGLELVLPTEAQWEYACRAGTPTATYVGDLEILGERNAPVLDPIAWYGGNSGADFELEGGFDSSGWPEKQYPHQRAGTHPVGRKRPNFWGLYDMLGNVWEWCQDGMRTYQDEAEIDPLGPLVRGAGRVVRGGSWSDYARGVRAAYRYRNPPGDRYDILGFRCARVHDGTAASRPEQTAIPGVHS